MSCTEYNVGNMLLKIVVIVYLVYCLPVINPSLFPLAPLERRYNYTPPENEVTFYLYHSSNLSESNQIFIGDPDSLYESNFNAEVPTIIIIHGWTHNKDVPWLIEMREAMAEAYLGNIIVVDWAPLSHVIYVEARIHTSVVSKQVANFLKFLKTYTEIPMSSVHIIGHSLGAQISGMIGNRIQTALDEKIGRISGLDPASPLFEWPHIESLDDVLDASDAIFVDVIHTNGRHLGMIIPAGHVDYYPNGGELQVGCGSWLCSHMKSCEYWTASVRNPHLFKAYAYKSWNEFLKGKINNLENFPMGIAANPYIPHGIYFVEIDNDVQRYITSRTTIKNSLN